MNAAVSGDVTVPSVTHGIGSRAALDEELRKLPQGEGFAKLVQVLAWSAFDEQRDSLDQGVLDAAALLGVDEVGAETSYGNVLRAIRKGNAASSAERELLGGLLARGVAVMPVGDDKAIEQTALVLLHVASKTVADATPSLDLALPLESADALWRAFGRLVRGYDEGVEVKIARPQAIIATLAIARSASANAHREALALSVSLRDPTLKSLLAPTATRTPGEGVSLTAELATPPRGPVVLFLMTVTFILPILTIARVVGRLLFHYRQPAELTVASNGVTVKSRALLFGRTLRERSVHIPPNGLAEALREVRYPRLGLYVGLATLLFGSYLGFRFLTDGARAGSPEFLGVGFLILAVSVVVDYALSRFTSKKSACEIVLVPRAGRAIALGALDRTSADRALASLASHLGVPYASK